MAISSARFRMPTYMLNRQVTVYVRLCTFKTTRALILGGWVSLIALDKRAWWLWRGCEGFEQKNFRLADVPCNLSLRLRAFKWSKWRVLLLQQSDPGHRRYSPWCRPPPACCHRAFRRIQRRRPRCNSRASMRLCEASEESRAHQPRWPPHPCLPTRINKIKIGVQIATRPIFSPPSVSVSCGRSTHTLKLLNGLQDLESTNWEHLCTCTEFPKVA